MELSERLIIPRNWLHLLEKCWCAFRNRWDREMESSLEYPSESPSYYEVKSGSLQYNYNVLMKLSHTQLMSEELMYWIFIFSLILTIVSHV